MQNNGLQCVKYWEFGTCSIPNCEYCLQKNVCAVCREGFNLTSNACSPICTVANCYQCANSTVCGTCALNYTWNSVSNTCQSLANISADCK